MTLRGTPRDDPCHAHGTFPVPSGNEGGWYHPWFYFLIFEKISKLIKLLHLNTGNWNLPQIPDSTRGCNNPQKGEILQDQKTKQKRKNPRNHLNKQKMAEDRAVPYEEGQRGGPSRGPTCAARVRCADRVNGEGVVVGSVVRGREGREAEGQRECPPFRQDGQQVHARVLRDRCSSDAQ